MSLTYTRPCGYGDSSLKSNLILCPCCDVITLLQGRSTQSSGSSPGSQRRGSSCAGSSAGVWQGGGGFHHLTAGPCCIVGAAAASFVLHKCNHALDLVSCILVLTTPEQLWAQAAAAACAAASEKEATTPHGDPRIRNLSSKSTLK
jgi:hypothetical protein